MIARGRFVIDTHVHAQRMAAKVKTSGIKKGDYRALRKVFADAEVYDNMPRLLYDMERYGVDMCVTLPTQGFGFRNELSAEQVKKHPDKLIAMVTAVETAHKAMRGERKWTVEAAAEEIDNLLSTGLYRGGIGEGLPHNPARKTPITWPQRFKEICVFMDLARKHKVPVGYHTGINVGYTYGGHTRGNPEVMDPMLCLDIALEYTDVPIIMHHAGMIGWWSERFLEQCFQVAATCGNVYLETGRYLAEHYEKPLSDPNIGPEKLIWGTDWGASVPIFSSSFAFGRQYSTGGFPPTFSEQVRKYGVVAHQVDVWGWSLRQLAKLEISQDDLNLILGGNAVKLFNLKTPFTRLFKEYLV